MIIIQFVIIKIVLSNKDLKDLIQPNTWNKVEK